ncbi:thiamine diphosphokinase [Legionella pneumophila]|uniref:Thiamine diphosphokinase n=1 Tax=Legionella pneumophila subsp. pascullei TaxID=91890 RepID=A0AAX2J091_LEGPN|nr:thiamine diphosphokinase [Legionella pneumophila]AMP93391.1 thiamine pyrophosphokinase [Legionella pneumophila subsp. pascullei]AMP96357.1 thiamine pyrophosphokinase [Legionella pneumophila subsp. pascullei]SQG91329.1 thiamine pyrophosphokinase [Legionella pneumophila subsp. pascullei]VEH07875.1 thiamine pyrophosphokinase [Legionella pneumophila subsp. pascullei]HDU8260244.1 thiamine diphosphokinase [Legionella pneumophila]
MLDVINFKDYRSILCLNGDLPAPSFFHNKRLPVIAADGAANVLCNQGIFPDLITGDLDSIQPALLENHSFLHLPDQGSTDYQKAMDYLKTNDLLPAIVVGINGGYLDHILNNINIFMETNCLLYSPPIKGFVVKEKLKVNFTLPFQTKISLIGIPEVVLSSDGLKWELKRSSLSFPGKNSCFNRTQKSEISLEVHQGAALVLIYEEVMEDAGVSSLSGPTNPSNLFVKKYL